jgi:Short C-terminal domain
MKRHTKVALMIGGIVIVTLCIVNHIALLSPAGLIGLIMAAVGLFARRDYPRVRRYPSPQPPPLQSDVVSQPLRTTPPQPALQTHSASGATISVARALDHSDKPQRTTTRPSSPLPAQSQRTASTSSLENELRSLAALKADGIISEEEFTTKKRALLGI